MLHWDLQQLFVQVIQGLLLLLVHLLQLLVVHKAPTVTVFFAAISTTDIRIDVNYQFIKSASKYNSAASCAAICSFDSLLLTVKQ